MPGREFFPVSDTLPPESQESAESPEEMVPLGHYKTAAGAFEESLVVLAMGHSCQVDVAPEGGFRLSVDPPVADPATEELECYRAEQALPKPRPVLLPDYGNGGLLTALWLFAVAFSFFAQGNWPAWEEFGLMSVRRLWENGEWWRPFTALFLHADVAHVLGNALSGTLFGTWVCRSLGPLRGWALILLAGALGNFCNGVAHHGEEFRSLGASTAVFGALGALTGHGLRHVAWSRTAAGFRSYGVRRLVPLLAGLALLGMTGAGETPRTDVAGHFFGFSAGVVLGALAAPRPRQEP